MEKEETSEVNRADYDYLKARLNNAFEDRQKIKKMVRVVLAIMIDKKMIGEETAKAFMESKEAKELENTNQKIIKWYESKANFWMQKAVKKEGTLRSALGIKEGEKIPMSILTKIKNAKIGETVSFKGKNLKVTALLKKRAVLAITFKSKAEK